MKVTFALIKLKEKVFFVMQMVISMKVSGNKMSLMVKE
jgi:hypothetical protein